MEASELRIGNFLRDSQSRALLKVIELAEEKVNTYVMDRELFPLAEGWKIEPIRLDEEWLERFEFERLPHENPLRTKGTFRLMQGSFENFYNYVFYYDKVEIVIKFVHELQNLYHALTNEELIYEGMPVI